MPQATISVIDYNTHEFHEYFLENIQDCFHFRDNQNVTWIDIAQNDKETVHAVCDHFHIHYLLEEDIRSHEQRPKMDEQDNIIFFLLYMLRGDKVSGLIEKEQVSIVLGPKFVITFQEEPETDAFERVRKAIKAPQSLIRSKEEDFLCYSLLDAIVDDYQLLIEHFGDKIEQQEDDLILKKDLTFSLTNISLLRKELMLMRRNISPVREIINSLLRNSNALIDKKTTRYFKDIYDHILQSQDILETYHDSLGNLHDLYLSKESLKMNESMNIMAIVTCLLAPATVIGGIFGMNFDRIPFLHDRYSFYVIIAFLAIVFIAMIAYFKRKKWL